MKIIFFLTRPSQGREVWGCLAAIAFFMVQKTNKQEKKNIKNVKYVWKKKRTKKILPVASYRQSAFSKSLLSRTHIWSFLKVPHGNNHKIQLFVSFNFTLCQESWQSREIVTDIKLAGVNKQVVTTLQQILIN